MKTKVKISQLAMSNRSFRLGDQLDKMFDDFCDKNGLEKSHALRLILCRHFGLPDGDAELARGFQAVSEKQAAAIRRKGNRARWKGK